jgi:hypothetical protein
MLRMAKAPFPDVTLSSANAKALEFVTKAFNADVLAYGLVNTILRKSPGRGLKGYPFCNRTWLISQLLTTRWRHQYYGGW